MGFWQIFLPTENCTTPAMFLRQTATGAGAPCQMYCQACRQSCQTSCQMTRKLPAGMHVRSTEQQARCATSSDVFLEGWILRFSCVFLGCTRYCCWCIAVYFKFLEWKSLHCTLYHAEHLVCRHFSHECRLTCTLLVLLSIFNVQTADSSDSESSNPPSSPPSPSQTSSSESDSDGTGTSGSASGLSSHASQTATDSDVPPLTSVDGGLPSGVKEDSGSASDEILWAKGTRGGWDFGKYFCQRKIALHPRCS